MFPGTAFTTPAVPETIDLRSDTRFAASPQLLRLKHQPGFSGTPLVKKNAVFLFDPPQIHPPIASFPSHFNNAPPAAVEEERWLFTL